MPPADPDGTRCGRGGLDRSAARMRLGRNSCAPAGVVSVMDVEAALDFARTTSRSVLTTLRRDGLPQLSNVTHWTAPDGIVRISITADRAKYFNLRRRPWAALHVTSTDFWSYAVLEGDVELTAVAADPGDATVEELIAYYRALSGEHPDWADYRRAMVADRRVVARIRPTRSYGALR